MSLLTSLAGYWKLDEASGANDAVDATGNGKTLTQHNSPGSTTGVIGTARTFSGSNQYFGRAGSDTDLQTGAVDWTFQAWVNFTNFTQQRPIACKDSLGSNREWTLYIETDDTPDHLQFNVFNGSSNVGQVLVDSSGFSTGTFMHVVARYTTATKELALFVNGTKTTATGSSDPAASSSAEFEIGSLGAFYMHVGAIDECGFWRRALTDTEIAINLYNGGAGLSFDSFGGAAGGAVPFGPRRAARNKALLRM